MFSSLGGKGEAKATKSYICMRQEEPKKVLCLSYLLKKWQKILITIEQFY